VSKVHDLINYERKKRGISTVYWSRGMARLAQSQANYCARVGHLVHSNRYAFRGGENLAEGASNFTPRAIVNCWLGSKAGHRQYLLSPRVRKAGVGIAKSRGKTYVAWAFSDQPPSYPDCPYFKRTSKGVTSLLLSRKGKLRNLGVIKMRYQHLRTLWKQLRGRLVPFRVKRAFKTFWNIFKRVLVVVVVLAVTALVVAAVCGIITTTAKLSVGIILALLGIGLLAWGVKSLSLHRLSSARTFMVVFILGLFVLASSAYLDIRSPMDIKDSVTAVLTGNTSQFRTSVDAFVGRVELKIVEQTSTSDEDTREETEEATEQSKNTKHVYINGGVLAGADGHRIVLHNNPNAENPTWEELEAFLLADKTDEHSYNRLTFVCADFAEMVHNNAEAAGIKAAYVCVELGACSYFLSGGGHALNAFDTTDRGLVYIDCTGPLGSGPRNSDKTVDVQVGKEYIPGSIFPEAGWASVWESMGVVQEIEVVEW